MSDLRSFLKQLEKKDELIKIKESLSPKLEIAAALQRFDGGKALLFEKVDGYNTRVIGGVCGTRQRILDALGLKAEELYPALLDAIRAPKK